MNIGEVAKATGLTKKAIRYYQDMGLISPAVNSDNNYREYSEEDVARLKVIRTLRRLDLTAAEILEALSSPERLAEVLRRRIAGIREEIKAAERREAVMESLLDQIDERFDIAKATDKLNALLDSLELDAMGRAGYMRQQLARIFPGQFGAVMSIMYGRFLDEPLDTPEKKQAWLSLVNTLDEMEEIELPEKMRKLIDSMPADLAEAQAEIDRKLEKIMTMSDEDKRQLLESKPWENTSDEGEAFAEAWTEFFMAPQVRGVFLALVRALWVLSADFRKFITNQLHLSGIDTSSIEKAFDGLSHM